MSVTSNGTPALVNVASPSNAMTVTGTFPTGASPAAGDLIVAVVTAYGSTAATSVAQHSGTTGYANPVTVTGANCLTSIWTKTATGSDSAPAFDGTVTGTAGDADMTVTVYDLSDPATGNTPVLDTSGTAIGTTTLPAVTTSGNVSAAGELAVCAATVGQGITAATAAWTTPTNWTLAQSGNAQTASARSQTANYFTTSGTVLPAGSTATVTIAKPRTTTTHTSALIAVFKPVITSGGPLGTLNQPAGVRVSLVRTGLVMATLLPMVTAGPPPTSGPPVTPLPGPAGIHKVLPPRGRVHRRSGTWQGTGPPVPALHSPVSAGAPPPASAQQVRLPAPGRVYGIRHGGVAGGTGPAAAPLRRPVTAAVRVLPPRGTIRHLAGVYATQGPPLRPHTAPVRAPVPQRAPGGTVTRRAGALATLGPKVTPLTRPVRAAARRVLPSRGRVAFTPVIAVQAVVNVIAVHGAIPAAVRAALPATPKGRAAASPVRAATAVTSGPPVTPLRHPVRASLPLQPSLTGRAMAIAAIPGPVNPAPASGPPIAQRGQPWQAAKRVQPLRGTTAGTRAGTRSGQGPAVRPLSGPVRARQPLPHAGRVYSLVKPSALLPGPVSGPPLPPRGKPWRAPVPAPYARGTARHEAGAYAGTGPAVPPLGQPPGVRVVLARTGHVQQSAVQAQPPPPPTSGPPIAQRGVPWRAALPPPRVHGFALAMGAIPAPTVVPPTSGPAIPARGTPWRAPVPARTAGGHARSSGGVRNGTGPAAAPLHGPVRAAWPARTRGGTGHGLAGTYTAVVPTSGPPIPPRAEPWRALIPARTRGGTAHGGPGTRQATGPPVRPLAGPVTIRHVLPHAGRASGNPGGPVIVVPATVLFSAGRARLPWTAGRARLPWTAGEARLPWTAGRARNGAT